MAASFGPFEGFVGQDCEDAEDTERRAQSVHFASRPAAGKGVRGFSGDEQSVRVTAGATAGLQSLHQRIRFDVQIPVV